MIRRLLLILFFFSTVAFADIKVKHRSGCPLEFRVPKGWSVDADSNCGYTILSAIPMRMIDFRGYSGTVEEAEQRYRMIEKDTPRGEVGFGEFRGYESLKGRAYVVVSNGDLLVEMRSVSAPEELMRSIASSLRATGRSSQNKKHKKLFPRACGVKLDYPPGWFVDRGRTKESRCEATLRSAVPARVNASADVTITAVKKKPVVLACVSREEVASRTSQVFAGEGWVAASVPLADRSDESQSSTQLTLYDGCERRVTIVNPNEQMRDLALQTIRFRKSKCKNRITMFPVCEGNGR